MRTHIKFLEYKYGSDNIGIYTGGVFLIEEGDARIYLKVYDGKFIKYEIYNIYKLLIIDLIKLNDEYNSLKASIELGLI